MSEREFNERLRKFQEKYGAILMQSINDKIMSQYEIQKALGKTGDELMLEILRYSLFDAVNRVVIHVLKEVTDPEDDAI